MARIGQHQNIVKLYSAWVEHITDNLSTHFHDKLGINNLTNGLISSQSVISDYSTSNSSELKNEANYLLFIQLELCSSLTLRNVLDSRCDYLAYSDLLRIFTEISIAVNHVHDQEFVHRDIKPENVYFKDQVAKLGDFGLAYCLNLASRAGTDPQAKSVDIAGTPLYVAPDKIQSKASDVYSMGILLFEMMEIFSTQMERSIAVGELKMGRISEKIASRYPGISKLLLSMVNPESSNRPSTQSILDSLSHLSPI